MEVMGWSETLQQEIQKNEAKRNQTLFLEQHPDYPTYLLVNSFDPLFSLEPAVPVLRLDQFYSEAEANGYSSCVFLDDQEEIVSWLDDLDDPYPYDLNVELKRFQLQGFNYTKALPSAIINWSTGTGKSVYAVARAKYMLEEGLVDKVIVASKNHNKINWQRTFKGIGDMRALVDDQVTGSSADAKRQGRTDVVYYSNIFIVNYEKFRFRSEVTKSGGDGQEILDVIKGKRVLWIWDEMPSKLRNMSTTHFKGIQKIMRSAKKNYQVSLTATKIETNPENIYTCMKILDPTVWPNKQKFRAMYAKSMSTFSPWQVATWDTTKLHELGMRISHMTHVANKYTDPEIRAEFPEDHWEDVYIDMSVQDRILYDAALNELIADLPKEYNSILTKMSVLQMICDNPAMVTKSQGALAQALSKTHTFTDKNSAKLEKLHDMLDEIDGKIVLFSMYNDFGAKMLMQYLAAWGHKFVLYDGAKKQDAEDRFRADSRIKVFLSSDQGSDSINLEKATTVINYNLPWNYSTLIQRVNRISRLTSEADHVFYYNLIMANTIEERKLKVLNKKRLYEESIDLPLSDQEILSSASLDELKWILLGK